MLSTKQQAMTEFVNRRQHLIKKLAPNSIAIVASAPAVIRNGDSHYPYRQNSDFYYLTGFNEPNAVMVLVPDRAEGECILFNEENNLVKERWDGKRVGQEEACKHFGMDQAFSIQKINEILPQLFLNKEIIYYCLGRDALWDKRIMQWINAIKNKSHTLPTQFISIETLLHEQRLFKNTFEIEQMRQAAQISVEAHQRAMQMCQPGLYEYELEAELLKVFYQRGCRFPAYTSIVASGENACTLHYVQNHSRIAEGDLVLIDAAGEYENYAADITRTFPANGRFSKEQAAIYEIVLAAQLAGIAQVRVGNAWNAIQQAIVTVITQGLIDLNILQGELQELIALKAYQNVYMHGSGHWLGLDVHDVGAYQLKGQSRLLEAGMVLTVEPGIYISSKGIGIRIEDDVLVTERGPEVLSAALPKTISEIEKLVGTGHKSL